MAVPMESYAGKIQRKLLRKKRVIEAASAMGASPMSIICKVLLNEALEKITSYGPVQIELLTDDTEKTKKFYESVGFVQVKEMDAVSYIKDTRR